MGTISGGRGDRKPVDGPGFGQAFARLRRRIADLADRPLLTLIDNVVTPLCAPLGPGARVVLLGPRDLDEQRLYAGRLERAGYEVSYLSTEEIAEVGAVRRDVETRRLPEARRRAAAMLGRLCPARAQACVVTCAWVSVAVEDGAGEARVIDAAARVSAFHLAWGMTPL